MNPDNNKFEQLKKVFDGTTPQLLRPNGTPVPEHWSIFQVGDRVVIKNYTFQIAYINETTMLLEPMGPMIIGDKQEVRDAK